VSRILRRPREKPPAFPRSTAVVLDPTRGAKPLSQGVAVRGRGWQNLLPLCVSGGCAGESFIDLPRPAIACQHSVRHLLHHHLKANPYGDDRATGCEPRAGGRCLKDKVTAPPEKGTANEAFVELLAGLPTVPLAMSYDPQPASDSTSPRKSEHGLHLGPRPEEIPEVANVVPCCIRWTIRR
jgi:hypothetical protein